MGSMIEANRSPCQGRQQADYLSFLLRLWRLSLYERGCHYDGGSCPDTDRLGWRASLETPYTGERIGFGNIEDLFDFLRAQVGLVFEEGQDQETEARSKTGE